MAQDFAKRSKSRKKKPPPGRFSLGSFVAGVIVGVSLFLLGAYGPELLSTQLTPTTAQTADPAATADPIQQAQAHGEPRASVQDLEFEFRELLGTDSVDPDLSAYEADVKNHQATAAVPMHYLLQSGSFQIKADAESRRGTLLLLNMPANIVEAQIDNKIWYRVIVGPYAQRGEAQQAAARLKSREIGSIWMERPITKG